MFSLFGLKVGGLSNQGDFLTKLGIEKRAEILSKNSLFTEKANIFFRMKRLVDVRKMGKLFKVIFICNKKINFKFGLK
jgi:NADH dehydrogenase [ubiquinone] 1 alpha subcomplex assembly factor 7